MRVQSGDDCGGDGDDSGYADDLDLRAEFADTVPVWDGRGLPPLQGYYPDGRGRPSPRERASQRFAILHTWLVGGGWDGGAGANETRQAASLRR